MRNLLGTNAKAFRFAKNKTSGSAKLLSPENGAVTYDVSFILLQLIPDLLCGRLYIPLQIIVPIILQPQKGTLIFLISRSLMYKVLKVIGIKQNKTQRKHQVVFICIIRRECAL